MKRTLLIPLVILFIIICITCIFLINLKIQSQEIKRENAEFEIFLNKEVLGTDVASLISKAVDKNEKNNIQKDDRKYYIDNDENSIKIDLKMTTIEKTYPMEEIYNNNITEFVKNFNSIKFKCTSIEYHKKTGKISRITFEELS